MIALLSMALAGDDAGIWVREAVGFGGWPSGAVTDTRVQYRAPLHRSDSIVFRDTFAGVGGRLAVTPAYIDVGPRISLAPIDVFDIDLQASFVGYWPTRYGPMPFSELEGTLEADRGARDDALSTWAVVLTAAPTLKLQLGPIVAFDAWTISHWRFKKPAGIDAPWTYEPFNDMILAWTDTMFEHQAVVMVTILPGGDKPSFWVGPTFRDRFTMVSKDRSVVLGGVIMTRPIVKPWAPPAVIQVLPYLQDSDRRGGAPNVQAQLFWVFE